MALGVLMPLLAYIPKAILSSVIITSVIFMVELKELKPMWKTNSKYYTAYYCNNINSYLITNHYLLGVELLPFGVTFFSCLFINMEYGILIGVAVHMFILSYMSNKPRLDVTISVCLQHCETKFKLFKNI